MNKYTTADFKALTEQERILRALTAIANELHNIYDTLHHAKEEKN